MLSKKVKQDQLQEIFTNTIKVYKQKDSPSFKDIKNEVKNISFLKENWIPKSFITLLTAREGIGKTWVAIWYVQFTINKGFNVLWVDTEGFEAALIERFEKMKIDLNKIKRPSLDFSDYIWSSNLEDRSDRMAIESVVKTQNIGLIIIDSFRTAHQKDENSSSVISIMKYLNEVAKKYYVPVLLVHHHNKGTKGSTFNSDAIRGNTSILSLPRVIAMCLPYEDDCIAVGQAKANLRKKAEPEIFEIKNDGIKLTDKVFDSRKVITELNTKNAIDIATDFLRESLKKPTNVNYVIKKSKDNGISEPTLRRAKKKLGIVSIKDSTGWKWSLPSLAAATVDGKLLN